MIHEYDPSTGRPLVDGHEAVQELADDELEVELTIAVAEPRHRANRLDRLLYELAQRRGRTVHGF